MTPLKFELRVTVEANDSAMTMTVAGSESGVVGRVELPPVIRWGANDLQAQTQEERDVLAGVFMRVLRETSKRAWQRQREAEEKPR